MLVILGPVVRVAGRVFGSDQNVVAKLWAAIDGDVAVADHGAQVLEIKPFRGGHVHDLLAQWTGFDGHVIQNAGHAVDDRRSGPGDVDDNRRVQVFARGQFYAFDPTV